ncbi:MULTISPECIES: FHA domain-containing protein [Shouchella]|uniref:FHA domain-containing protein n=2 Tax=Shouchella clausii TaxID=79880 RepID=Q5WC95_SHOC1|nr:MULTISPECIES: FHA domain-containing protein [Shouchella]MBX0319391.1 FHA domain-containing protein [Shouchella clausii]MCZ1182808.1 FHA domain-containing protein [Shouchella clausii]MDO7266463.1 FHA domain-containing protein [Shouchella clausii]MDO7286622.1 FHA domain-containing protein [Shouchella clausii]PAD16869.1 hypothetical protein CHH73_11005 [Shouchella clausii]
MQKTAIQIIKGQGFPSGEQLFVRGGRMLIGRAGPSVDIGFADPYISRKHALIEEKDGDYTITDLNSKHGVEVNRLSIPAGKPFPLHHSDSITLAKGVVELTFLHGSEQRQEQTRELDAVIDHRLVVHKTKRQVIVDGKRLALSGKHIELLFCLYDHRNRAVSYEELKANVWPERLAVQGGTVPDVEKEEVNALVYRLRKKLGAYSSMIVTIPRYGYMLDLGEGRSKKG